MQGIKNELIYFKQELEAYDKIIKDKKKKIFARPEYSLYLAFQESLVIQSNDPYVVSSLKLYYNENECIRKIKKEICEINIHIQNYNLLKNRIQEYEKTVLELERITNMRNIKSKDSI